MAGQQQISASGGGFDPNVDPGPVNPPAIFEPPEAIIPGSAPQVWVAASGGANWGGALVSISFDGTNYDTIGTITSAAYQGLLTANLPAATGLDFANTLAIDLTESEGIFPTAATHADAVALRTLSYVCAAFSTTAPSNGELLAYGAVSATGTYTNNLTYLERGAYGTTGSAHATGDFYSRIDLGEVDTPPNSVVTYNLPTQYIGATIWLKLQSFNVFGNALEDISTVTAYEYVPSGSGYGGGSGGVPAAPTGLSGSSRSGVGNTLTWNANSSGDHVTNYVILRRVHATGSYASIGTPTNNTYLDTTAVSGTQYDYEVEAVNAVGTSAASSSITVTTL